jgi:hypothetical protein
VSGKVPGGKGGSVRDAVEALTRAGWAVGRIAGTLGVSERCVRGHVEAMAERQMDLIAEARALLRGEAEAE